MAIIFTTGIRGDVRENRGRVVSLEKPGTGLVPGSILHAPAWGGFTNFKAIFTNITISEQSNYQFLHTLGNHIYVYVFGDRIGTFGLSGLAFFDNCEYQGGANDKLGIVHVLEYYRRLKISNNSSPLLVTLAPDTVFRTFLLGFRGQVLNAATRIFQFNLSFALVPGDVGPPAETEYEKYQRGVREARGDFSGPGQQTSSGITADDFITSTGITADDFIN